MEKEDKKKELKELTDAQKDKKKKNIFYKAKKNLSEKVRRTGCSRRSRRRHFRALC